MDPGELVRTIRERQGISQAQLALRAGTTQPVISRLERGGRPPTLETIERVLLALGHRVVLEAEPLPLDVDELELRRQLAHSPDERLARALGWNRFAAEVSEAGARARGGGT